MIKSLISLRGIFILFIFLHHCGVYPGGGTLGVAFFFVLSGFSMALGYGDKVINPNFSYKQFITRRIIKFYPLHWITLVANIPLTLMGTLSWWLLPVFFVNAALLHTLIPIQKVYFSYNAVSWFLADIMIFSLLFPFLFKLQRRIMMNNWGGYLLLFLLSYISLLLVLPLDLWRYGLYINPFIRITDYLFGILLARFFFRIKESKTIYIINKEALLLASFSLGILTMESFIFDANVRKIAPLYWPFIAMLIIVSALSNKKRLRFLENKLLLWLGEYSFTIFLIHRLVIRYVAELFPIQNSILNIIICFFVTLFFSYTTSEYLISPITRWLSRKNLPSMTVQS